MNWNAIFWLIAMVIFLIAEAATVTLVSIWFAVGALVAVVAALLGAGTQLQIVLFLVVSAVLLLSLRSVVRRYITPHTTRTNVDSLIGTVGVVTTPVNNLAAMGQVMLAGSEWSARSTTGEPLPEGMKVRVDRIEGVKVFVSATEASVKE